MSRSTFDSRYAFPGAGDSAAARPPPVPSVLFLAVGAARHVILVVGTELPRGVEQGLVAAGFAPCFERTLDAARSFLRERIPAAVVLGAMPGTEQLDLLRWVRAQERFAFVQVFLSPAVVPVARALEHGADDVFDTADPDAVLRIGARIQRARSLAQLALLDPLTQLHNRLFMTDRLEAEIARAARADTVFSLAMIDLDHFKSINDTFGHLAGDRALVAFARARRRDLRAYDVPCRFGGDEFVVLFPDCDAAGARAALAKLRGLDGWVVDGLPPLTFSAGIAQFPGDGASWASLFDVADRNAMAAKRAGRITIPTRIPPSRVRG